MGGSQEPEAGGGKAGYSSSGLPPSSPPHLQDQPPQQYQHGYGTFQSPQAGSGESRQPPVGFPQPAPPPGFGGGGGYHQQLPYAPAEPYYAQGYQAVQGCNCCCCHPPGSNQRNTRMVSCLGDSAMIQGHSPLYYLYCLLYIYVLYYKSGAASMYCYIDIASTM
ncbi:uncharacterized protein LOC133929420 isoform X2 [Phragmites australis]|uniref:uncharacterized protein LOC133929420 isoform X2 n=1 Tax=Phragmites australis TaxID=29695 RepID=UPI002D76BD4B|nr:uncharacterized protein LOC133929420 isoform X2 [Phragmites australis]